MPLQIESAKSQVTWPFRVFKVYVCVIRINVFNSNGRIHYICSKNKNIDMNVSHQRN